MAQGSGNQVYVPPQFERVSNTTAQDPTYTASGGSGVWRLRSAVVDSELGGIEKYQSKRRTKWFLLNDYEKNTLVRRVQMSYASFTPITVKVYKDYELLPAFSLNFPLTSQMNSQGFNTLGEKKLVSKKATTRARVLALEICTLPVDNPNYQNSKIEIYGMQVEVVPRRGKSS